MSFSKNVLNNVYYYEFENTCADSYDVVFSPSVWFTNTLAENFVFEIAIKPKNSKKNTDKNLLPTLLPIIEDFMSNINFAVMYVCDSSDSQARGKARAKLFEKWYKQSNSPFIRHTQSTINDSEYNMTYYNGIISHIDNPLSDILLEIFEHTAQELNK